MYEYKVDSSSHSIKNIAYLIVYEKKEYIRKHIAGHTSQLLIKT